MARIISKTQTQVYCADNMQRFYRWVWRCIYYP